MTKNYFQYCESIWTSEIRNKLASKAKGASCRQNSFGVLNTLVQNHFCGFLSNCYGGLRKGHRHNFIYQNSAEEHWAKRPTLAPHSMSSHGLEGGGGAMRGCLQQAPKVLWIKPAAHVTPPGQFPHEGGLSSWHNFGGTVLFRKKVPLLCPGVLPGDWSLGLKPRMEQVGRLET